MAKWVKNTSGNVKVWGGQQIQNQAYYELESSEYFKWGNDSSVLTDISSGELTVAKDNSGNTDITDVAEAINYLKDLDVKLVKTKAFADKEQLFFRGQGISQIIPANSTQNLIFTLPYLKAKLNGIEVLYGKKGDTCNFKVLDTTTGTYTTVPNYLLNQFGYDWNVEENSQKEILPYDADIFQNMQLVVEYTNNSNADNLIGINFYIHEDKS
jgi:hypothetical protein